jgi:hypothetical protein
MPIITEICIIIDTTEEGRSLFPTRSMAILAMSITAVPAVSLLLLLLLFSKEETEKQKKTTTGETPVRLMGKMPMPHTGDA